MTEAETPPTEEPPAEENDPSEEETPAEESKKYDGGAIPPVSK